MHVSTTDKFLIFNITKVGSTYLSYKLGMAYNNQLTLTDTLLLKPVEEQPDKKTAISGLYADWDAVLNSRSKKDLIFLYRDPIDRFFSAFVQDWFNFEVKNESHFHKPNSPLKLHISEIKQNFINKGYTSNQIDFFFKNCLTDIDIYSKLLNTNESLLSFNFREMVNTYILFIWNHITSDKYLILSHHNCSYLSTIINVLLNDDIDKNKIKLVDIGETNIEDVFNLYNFGNSIKNKNHGYMYPGFTNTSNRPLADYIKQFLKASNKFNTIYEFHADRNTMYSTLKNSKYNLKINPLKNE